MNRSKIEWCDHTYNPITGCEHSCPYCYAAGMSRRFSGDPRENMMQKQQYSTEDGMYILDKEFKNSYGKIVVYPFGFAPTVHRYRFDYPGKIKAGMKIFVGAMADLFGEWVSDKWISEIFDNCQRYKQHIYLFLTKNQRRYVELQKAGKLPEQSNMWYGYSVPVKGTEAIELPDTYKTFISIEPLLEPVSIKVKTDWVIMGAETGSRRGKVVPEKEWIDNLLKECDDLSIPVFMKDSLAPIVGEENMRRQFPEEMERYLEAYAITPKKDEILSGRCNICKIKRRKNQMVTLLARCLRGKQPKQIGFICKDCAGALEPKYEINFSDVEGFDEKTEL